MFIPEFQACMLPMLQLLNQVEEISLADMKDRLAHHFGLNDEALEELLLSGNHRVFDTRVG